MIPRTMPENAKWLESRARWATDAAADEFYTAMRKVFEEYARRRVERVCPWCDGKGETDKDDWWWRELTFDAVSIVLASSRPMVSKNWGRDRVHDGEPYTDMVVEHVTECFENGGGWSDGEPMRPWLDSTEDAYMRE